MFLSGMIDEEPLKLQNDQVTEVSELISILDEADERLFIHINHAVETANVESLLTASSDTDALVYAVHYYHKVFKSSGLKKLWTFFGKGHSTRYIPVHDTRETFRKTNY